MDGPYYGAAFLSEALGNDGHSVAMLDSGTDTTAVYAVYSHSGKSIRVLVMNTAYFNGTGTRSTVTVPLTGLYDSYHLLARRLTAPTATSTVVARDISPITLGGQFFTPRCVLTGTQVQERVAVSSGFASVTLKASEALLVFL